MLSLALDNHKASADAKNEMKGGSHEDRLLTGVSTEDPEGTELLLDPSGHPAAKPFKDALIVDGIPFAHLAVADVHAEYERLRGLGVRFTQEPTTMGSATTAVLDDTRGNLIQLASLFEQVTP